MESNPVLIAKEECLKNVAKLLKPQGAVILIRANIPGEFKANKEAFILISLFEKECRKQFIVLDELFINSAAGPVKILAVRKHQAGKEVLVNIESTHSLGRMIDLDYYVDASKSISRHDLNLPLRKCYLCDNEAIKCIRENAHSPRRIYNFIQTQIYFYLQGILEKMIISSIEDELKLEHKFGCVTTSSCGSHHDMNHDIMIRSAKALLFSFTQMFWLGYDGHNLESIYNLAKKQGLAAEKLMYEVTDDINTYKGLIFLLGLVLVSVGYGLSHQQSIDEIFNNVAIMTKNIFHEPSYNTFGEKAFKEYNIGGARAEAHLGCPTVKMAYEYLNSLKEINDEALHMTLIKIIANTDDTVLLKRAGSLEKYRYFKNKISNITTYDLKLIQEVTLECINENVSCGGAADILVVALFLVAFNKMFLTL